MHGAIHHVIEANHVKHCSERVSRKRDQVVIAARHFLPANFQGSLD
jgi:hypothetical protein